MDYKSLSSKTLQFVGGKDNIISAANCMTRLRINVKDEKQVNYEGIKALDGVMGVVEGEQVQVIVGPGHAQRAKDSFMALLDNENSSGGSVKTERNIERETKERIKSKQTSKFQLVLKHIGNIFVPIIPGFIACGFFSAIANIIKLSNPALASNPWFALFLAMGGVLGGILHVVVGMNAAKEFGGSTVLGAIAGGFIYLPAFNGIAAVPGHDAVPLRIGDFTMQAGLGGVLGVILAAFVFAYIEKKVRKVIPASLDLFIVPFVTVLIGSVITAFIIIPIAAVIMKGITWLLIDVALVKGGVIGGFVLSSVFLPLVMLGIHQGLIPVHAQLIQQVGYTILLPILGMAGAGQVGSAIAIYMKTRDKRLRSTIGSSLPIGFLGVGEPLIYGVSLPLGRPFITACLGAGFGGAYLAMTGYVGVNVIGISGWLLIPVVVHGNWINYIIALCIAYVAGGVLTYLFGYNDSLLERLK